MERFLDAIHEAGAPIQRSTGEKGAIKLVDGREISADALDLLLPGEARYGI